MQVFLSCRLFIRCCIKPDLKFQHLTVVSCIFMKMLYRIVFIFVLLFFTNGVFAQNNEVGIDFYEKGDFKAAISSLKDSDEVKDLYYLGLAYGKISENGKAKDAFKKSFVKSYDLFFRKMQDWLKTNNSETGQNFSDFLREMKSNNEIGFAAAERAFELESGIFDSNEARIKANVLLNTVDLIKSGESIYSIADKSVSKAKVTEMPRLIYPKDMYGVPMTRFNTRQDLTITVKLFVVYGSDGQIKLIMPIDEVIDAFTVESLRAAGGIKFKPATKDDKSVTFGNATQYSFSSR